MNEEFICLYEEQARRVVGIDGWRLYAIQAIKPSGILIKGAVCTATFKRGPRKGQTNWSKRLAETERTVCFSVAEVDAFRAEWERETGKCNECTGTKQTLARWSSTEGTTYRTCRRCNGTGRAP